MRAAGTIRGTAQALLLTIIMIVGGAGCTTVQRDAQREAKLVAERRPDPVLSDLPRPRGFRMLGDQSIAAVAGDIRIARVAYAGAAPQSAVKQFYEEHLPRQGYVLEQMSLDAGRYALRFESAAETCTIRIREESGTTRVIVEVLPKSRQGTQRITPPTRRPR